MPEVPVCRVDLRDVAEELHAVDLAEDLVVLQVAQAVQKQLNKNICKYSFGKSRGRACKRFRSPGIDSKKSM